MLSFKVATRFLRRSPVQSGLIIAGIAVGIAVQIFVGSLITSLQANLLNTVVGTSPHVTIKADKRGDPVTFDARVASLVEGDARVTALAKGYDFSALYSPASGDAAPLNVKGGSLRELDTIYRVSRRTVAGTPRLDPSDLMIGKALADKYAIAPGDPIAIRLADGRDVNLTVSGVFDLGSAVANERTAFSSAQLGRSANGFATDRYTAVEVQLKDVFSSTAVAREWRQALPDLQVIDWQSQNADLLQALQSQGTSSYMIQAFVLIAVALGIASTLAISAVQKTRQIGILKAMGMSDTSAGLVFLLQAVMLGVTGTAAGIAAGYFLIWGFSFAPTTFDIVVKPGFVAFSAGIGIAVALLSSVIPMRKTSRLDPIEVIQRG